MDTLVITTVSNWYEVPRIRHQVAKQMSRFYNILYVETPTQWKYWYNTKIEKVEKNIIRCRLTNHFILPYRVYKYVPFLKDYHENFLLKEIYKIINIYKNSKFILINFNWDFIQIMRQDIFQLKIYLCNDDFASMINDEIIKEQLTKREQEVAVNADLCLGVSDFLVNKLKRYNDNSHLFLPGHEFTINRKKSIRKRCKKRIRIAFMGYIGHRLNFDYLEYASIQRGMEVNLIGPIEKNNKISLYVKNRLLIFHKSKFGQALQNFLESMDVLVIPFNLSKFNSEAITAPNKLFSYIATGKPIVISNLPNFIKFDYGIIYIADSKESFVSQIRKAYSEDSDELREKRFNIAEKNTWEKRGNELKAIIDENINRKFKYKTKE